MFAIGNNLNRAHNYFQDFWKRFSIFNKAQQLQLNRKQKQIYKKRGKEATWALPELASPPGSAQPTGPASHRPPRARRTRSAWPAPAATRRPPPASTDAWRRLGVPRDPHVPLSSSLTLPLVSLTLSRDARARSSPPFAVDDARATPSPLRRAQ